MQHLFLLTLLSNGYRKRKKKVQADESDLPPMPAPLDPAAGTSTQLARSESVAEYWDLSQNAPPDSMLFFRIRRKRRRENVNLVKKM